MRKINKLLNEILGKGHKDKKSLGSGTEQTTYPFEKKSGYVIKVLHNDNKIAKNVFEKNIKLFQKYPEIFPETSNLKVGLNGKLYYFQEKISLIPEFEKIYDKTYNLIINLIKDRSLRDTFNKFIFEYPDYHLRGTYLDVIILSEALRKDIGISIEDLKSILNDSEVILLNKIIQFTRKVIRITGQIPDVHEGNIGYNKKGKMKIFDL